MSLSKPLKSLLALPIKLALNPGITGALLLAILYYPEKLQTIVPDQYFPIITSDNFVNALKGALSLGVLRTVNNKLSEWVINNWKSPAKFVKSQEIVLISGGCSGIGLLMATEFAKMGTKVVVLDLGEPKSPLRKCGVAWTWWIMAYDVISKWNSLFQVRCYQFRPNR
jgi:all-trans-retinol dehydrogenase (NAD+)